MNAMLTWLPWRLQAPLRRYWPELFPNENTAQHWDQAWDKHGADGYRATGENTALRTAVVQAVPREAQRVLDVGCGTGETLALLRQLRPSATPVGVDFSAVAVDRARAAGFEAHVSCLPDLPFPDASFDAVICMETLEHVTDAKASLRSLLRVLRPGGWLLITVPNGAHDEEPIHVHRWTAAQLRSLLVQHETLTVIADHVEHGEHSLFARLRKS